MNNQQFAPFYVGQEVKCVKSHSCGLVQKGQKFTVTAVCSPCKCGEWLIAVGVRDPGSTGSRCAVCNHKTVDSMFGEAFLSHVLFRAITPTMEAVTFEKITEQYPVSVN